MTAGGDMTAARLMEVLEACRVEDVTGMQAAALGWPTLNVVEWRLLQACEVLWVVVWNLARDAYDAEVLAELPQRLAALIGQTWMLPAPDGRA